MTKPEDLSEAEIAGFEAAMLESMKTVQPGYVPPNALRLLSEVKRRRAEEGEKDAEIARLQAVAVVSQQLFGVKVARVEMWPPESKKKGGPVLIVTCPGADEQKLADLAGAWMESIVNNTAGKLERIALLEKQLAEARAALKDLQSTKEEAHGGNDRGRNSGGDGSGADALRSDGQGRRLPPAEVAPVASQQGAAPAQAREVRFILAELSRTGCSAPVGQIESCYRLKRPPAQNCLSCRARIALDRALVPPSGPSEGAHMWNLLAREAIEACIDPSLPPNVTEFRDASGKVIARILNFGQRNQRFAPIPSDTTASGPSAQPLTPPEGEK